MRGELELKVKKITISKLYYREEKGEPYHDLILEEKDGQRLYIVGDNNISKLLQEALREYYKNKKIQRRINKW